MSDTIPFAGSSHGKPRIAALDDWTRNIVTMAEHARSTTIGLTSGSREGNDRRVVDMLAKAVTQRLGHSHTDSRTLLVQLQVHKAAWKQSFSFERFGLKATDRPEPKASPLGKWSTVDVPMPLGATAAPALSKLPRWLPKWKEDFGLILIDLGPMNQVPSRTIGRLCDCCFLLLGPDSCAAQEWILQHIAWHERNGATIAGTIVSNIAA